MLREQAGIHAVKVALLAERAIVDYDPAIWDSEKLINVSAYQPRSLHRNSPPKPGNIGHWFRSNVDTHYTIGYSDIAHIWYDLWFMYLYS